jgi:hypothetical protein
MKNPGINMQVFVSDRRNNNIGGHAIEFSHYYKTRLIQLGFSTSTSEKTRTLLTWKTTSRFRQAVKCGHSHVGQDVSNDSEV